MVSECIKIQDKLTAIAGYPLWGKSSLSSKKIMKLLYEDWRLKKVFRTRKKEKGEKVQTLTADEVAIKRTMNKYPGHWKLQEVGKLILEHRR